MMTEAEYLNWRADSQTIQVRKIFKEQRQVLVDSLVNGGTLRSHAGTAEETAKLIGIIYGLDLFLEFEVTDGPKEAKDAKQK